MWRFDVCEVKNVTRKCIYWKYKIFWRKITIQTIARRYLQYVITIEKKWARLKSFGNLKIVRSMRVHFQIKFITSFLSYCAFNVVPPKSRSSRLIQQNLFPSSRIGILFDSFTVLAQTFFSFMIKKVYSLSHCGWTRDFMND